MQTVVVYDSKFGNTEHIAQAIARGAGAQSTVRVMSVSESTVPSGEPTDLLFLGGPTQRRRMSPDLQAFVERLPTGLQGVPTASFDTRYRGSTLLMGSAAREAAKRLQGAGGRLVAPPESFFIGRGGPLESQVLDDGELERAEAWATTVVAAVASQTNAPR